MKKFLNYILLLALLVMLALPIAFFNFENNQVSVVENRALVELKSEYYDFNDFMQNISDYVDDRIGFRDEMMRVYNQFIYGTLKGKHSNVISGDDGWLFYADDLPDYTGVNFNADRIETQVKIAKAIDEWCTARGIKFVLAVGSNKTSVYSEYMPDSIYQADPSATDYLVDRIRAEGICVIYPKEELIEHKSEEELYYRLDTHWNAFGSHYMLDQMVDELGLEEKTIPVEKTTIHTGDLLTMLGTGQSTVSSVEAVVTPNPNGEIIEVDGSREMLLTSEGTDKFVCYRDSFTEAMVDYYSYYFNGPILWNHVMDPQYIETEAPEYLIFSSVERFFGAALLVNEQFLYLE